MIIALGGGYFGWRIFASADDEIRYVLAAVERGTLITTVTGSGQVSASNQVDLKPKASGDVISVAAANGQVVRAGGLIVRLDSRDASKAVRDAEANLESARISFEKLKKPADALATLQAENSLAEARDSETSAEDSLKKSYDDALNSVANAFLDLPAVVTGLQDILLGTNLSSGQWNVDYYGNAALTYDQRALAYRDDARAKLQSARSAYDKNFQDYKSASRFSDPAMIESLLNKTYETTKTIADAVKSGNNLIQFYEDKIVEQNLKPAALADTHLASLGTHTAKTNTHLASLLGAKNSMQSYRDAITSSARSIAERTESLAKLKSGADELDIQAQELNVAQRENALLDAREKLADYFVRAPFDGTIAKVNVKKSDSISAGTVAAVLITKQKLAEISLNEVDVTKVKVGDKATLTFDAIEGLSIAGQVAEIDTVGTVTQGVVNYNLKIGFGTEDDRIKPGMSVSAAVIAAVRQNALTVPNSAVKIQGNAHYVETFSSVGLGSGDTASAAGITSKVSPSRRTVEIGAANDSATEILSGLAEGDLVVTRTINSVTAQPQTQQTSGLRLFGAPGGGARVR